MKMGKSTLLTAEERKQRHKAYNKKRSQRPDVKEKARLNNIEYRKKYPERIKKQKPEYSRQYWQKNRVKKLVQAKEKRDKLRNTVLNLYGNKCNCCNESELTFLALDHIKGNGNKHRRNLGDGNRAIYRLVRDFPEIRKDYQLLCCNCNWGKHINKGVCPHKIR